MAAQVCGNITRCGAGAVLQVFLQLRLHVREEMCGVALKGRAGRRGRTGGRPPRQRPRRCGRCGRRGIGVGFGGIVRGMAGVDPGQQRAQQRLDWVHSAKRLQVHRLCSSTDQVSHVADYPSNFSLEVEASVQQNLKLALWVLQEACKVHSLLLGRVKGVC